MMIWKKFSVKRKMLLVPFLTCLFLGMLLSLNWKVYSVVEEEATVLSSLQQGSFSLHVLMRGLAEYALSEGSPAAADLTRQGIDGFDVAYQELLHGLERDALIHSLQQEIGPSWVGLRKEFESYLEIDGISPYDIEPMILYGRLSIRADELLSKMDQLVEQEQEYAARLKRELGAVAIVFAVVTILVVLLMPALVYRDISKALEGVTSFANQTAEGDLTSVLSMQREDEIGVVAHSFARTTARLRTVVGKVRGITGDISEASSFAQRSSTHLGALVNSGQQAVEESAAAIDEMDQNINDIALRSEQLASTSQKVTTAIDEFNSSISTIADETSRFNIVTQDTASSVEEMINSVAEVANSVDQLNQYSQDTLASLTDVGASIKSIDAKVSDSLQLAEEVGMEASERGISTTVAAVEGMELIRQSVGTLAEVIGRLDHRSKEIGKMISVIEDVTDQTQLLALNAAILAAQAGKHGGPFSVVAEQIKQLAIRTGDSTSEVSELISAIRSETGSSVQLVQEGVQRVEEGMKLVQGTQQAFESIRHRADASARMSNTVYDSTAEQAKALKRVVRAVREISDQVAMISNATKHQREGGRRILETVLDTRMTSKAVANATVCQVRSCDELAVISKDALEMAGEIDAIIANQKRRSGAIVESIDTIRKAIAELTPSVSDVNRSVFSLCKDSESLADELREFHI